MPATILQDAVTPTILTSPSVTPSDTSATVFFNVTPPTGKVAGIWLEYTTSTDASWASVASVLGKTYIATATSESITTPSTLTSGTPYKYRLGVQINDSAVTYFPSANGGSFTTTTISNVNPIALGTVSVPTTTSISADYTLNLPTGAPTLTRHVGYSTTGTAGSYIFPSELSGGSATSQSYTSSITGLTSGSTYFVRIELREAGGAVYASQQTSSGTQVPTNPITVFSVVQGTTPTTLSVTFTAPITGSQVRQIRYGSTTVDITSSTSAYTITGLTANINYTVVMEILTAAQGGQVYATSSQVRATTAANSINSFSSSILRATEATFSYGVTTGATASFTVIPSTGVEQDTSLAGTLRLTGLAVGTPYSVTLSSILNGVTSTSTPLSITTKTPDVWKAIGDFVTRYYRIESGQTQTNQARISGINLSSITDLSGAIDGISSYTTGTAFDPLKADSISDDNRSIVNNRYTQALTDLTNVLNNVLPFRAALNAFNTNYTTTVQSNITGLPQTSVLSTAITQLSNYSTDAAILSNRLTTAPSVPPDYTQANNDLTFLTGTVLPFRTAVTTFGDKYYSNITKVTGTIDGAKYPNLQTAITRLDQSVSTSAGETTVLYSNATPRVFTIYTSVYANYQFATNKTVFDNALLEINRFLLEKAYDAFKNVYEGTTDGVPNTTIIADSTTPNSNLDKAIQRYATYGGGTFLIPSGTTNQQILTDTTVYESSRTDLNNLLTTITTGGTGTAATLQSAIHLYFSAYDDFTTKGIVPNLTGANALTPYTIQTGTSTTTNVTEARSTFYTGTSVDRTKVLTYAGSYDEGAAKTAFENARSDLNTKANNYVDSQLQTAAGAFRAAYTNTLQTVAHSVYVQKFKDLSGYTGLYTTDLSGSIELLKTYYGANIGSTYTLPGTQEGSANIGTKWTNRTQFQNGLTNLGPTYANGTFMGEVRTDIEALRSSIGAFFSDYDVTSQDERNLGYMGTDNSISGALGKKNTYYDGADLSGTKVYAWASTGTNNVATEKGAFDTARGAIETAKAFALTMVNLRDAYNTFWTTYGTGSIETVSHVRLISQKTGDTDYPTAAIAALGTYGASGTFNAPTLKPTEGTVSTDTGKFTNGNTSLTGAGGLLARIRTQASNLQSAVSTFVGRYTPLAQNAKDGIVGTQNITRARTKASTYYEGYPTNTTTISMTAVYTTVAAATTTGDTTDTTLFTNAKNDLDGAITTFMATLSNTYSAFRQKYRESTGGVENKVLIATDVGSGTTLNAAIDLLTTYGDGDTVGTPTPERQETQRITDIQTFTQGLIDLRELVGTVSGQAAALETAVKNFFDRYMQLSADIKSGIETVSYSGKDGSKISTATGEQATYFTGDTVGTYKTGPNPAYDVASRENEVAKATVFTDGLTELERAVTAYVNGDLKTKYEAFVGALNTTVNLTITKMVAGVSTTYTNPTKLELLYSIESQTNAMDYPSAAISLIGTYRTTNPTNTSDYTFVLPTGLTEAQKIIDAGKFNTDLSKIDGLVSSVLSTRTSDLRGYVQAFFTAYDGYKTLSQTIVDNMTKTADMNGAIAMRPSFYNASGFSESLLSTYVGSNDEVAAKATLDRALTDLRSAARTYIESQLRSAYSNFRGVYTATQNGVENSELIRDSLPVGGTNLPNLRSVRNTLLTTYGNGATATIQASRSDADVWTDKDTFVAAKTELEGLVGSSGTLIQSARDLSGAVTNFFNRYDGSDIAAFRNTLTLTTDTTQAIDQRDTFYENGAFSANELYTFVSNSDEGATKNSFEKALTELNTSIRNKYIADLSGSVVTFINTYGPNKTAIEGLPTSTEFTTAKNRVDPSPGTPMYTVATSNGITTYTLDSALFGTYVGTLGTDSSLQSAKTTFDAAKTDLDRLVDIVVPLRSAATTFKNSSYTSGLPETTTFAEAKSLLDTYFPSGGSFSVTLSTSDATFNTDAQTFRNAKTFRDKMMSVDASNLRNAITQFSELYKATNATRIDGFTQTANLLGSIADLSDYKKVDGTLFGSGFATYISDTVQTAYSSKQIQFEAGRKDLLDLLVRRAMSDFATEYTTEVVTALSTPTNLVPVGSTLATAISDLGIYWQSGGATTTYTNYVGNTNTTQTMLETLETQFTTGLTDLRTYNRSADLQQSILAFSAVYTQTNRDAYATLLEAQKGTIDNSVRNLGTAYVNGAFTSAFFTYVKDTDAADLTTMKTQFDNDVLRINTMLAMATFKHLYTEHAAKGLTGTDKGTADTNNDGIASETLEFPTSTLQSTYEGYAVTFAEALRRTLRGTIGAFRTLCSNNTSLLTSSLRDIYNDNSQTDYAALSAPITTFAGITSIMESNYATLVPRYMGTVTATGAFAEMFNRVLEDRRKKARTAIKEFHDNTWSILSSSYSSGQTAFSLVEGDAGSDSIVRANADKVALRGTSVNDDTTTFMNKTATDLDGIESQFNAATKALVLLLINKYNGLQISLQLSPGVRPATGIATDLENAAGTDTTRVRNAYIGTPPNEGVKNYWDQLIDANNAKNTTTARSTALAAMREYKGLYDENLDLLKDVIGPTYSNTNYNALVSTYLDVGATTDTSTGTTAFAGLTEVQYTYDITNVYSMSTGTAYASLLGEARDAMKKRISDTNLLGSDKKSYTTRYAEFTPIDGVTIPTLIFNNNPAADISAITANTNATELAVIRQEYYGGSGYVGHIAALETLIADTEREKKRQAAEEAIMRFYRNTYKFTQKYDVPTSDARVSACITDSATYLEVTTAYGRKTAFTNLDNGQLDGVKSTFESGFRLLVQAAIKHFLLTYVSASEAERTPVIDVALQVKNKIDARTAAADLSGADTSSISVVESTRDTYLSDTTGLWALLNAAVLTQVKTHVERFEAVLNKATTLNITGRTFSGRTVSTDILDTKTIAELATIYDEYNQASTGHSVLLLSDIQAAFTAPTGVETVYENLYNAYDNFQKDLAVQTIHEDLSGVPTATLPRPTTTTYTVTNMTIDTGFPGTLQKDYDTYVGTTQTTGRITALLGFTKTQLAAFVGSFNTTNTANLSGVTGTTDYVTITPLDTDTIDVRVGQLNSARANAAKISVNQLQLDVLNTLTAFNTSLYSNNSAYITLPATDGSDPANRIRTALNDVATDSVALTTGDTATDAGALATMKSKYVQASVDLLTYILNGLSAKYEELGSLYTTYATFKSNDNVSRVLPTLTDISGTSPNTSAQETILSLRSTTTATFSTSTVSSITTLRDDLVGDGAPAQVKAQIHAYINAFRTAYVDKRAEYREPYSTYQVDFDETTSTATTPTPARLLELLDTYMTNTANLDITNAKMAAITPLSQFYTDLYTANINLLTSTDLATTALGTETPTPTGATRNLQSAVDNALLLSERIPNDATNEIESTTELNTIQAYYTSATTAILLVIRGEALAYLTTYIRLRSDFDTFFGQETGFYAALTAAPSTLPTSTSAEALKNNLSNAALTYTGLSSFFGSAKDYPAHLNTLYAHVKSQLTGYIGHFYTEYSVVPAPRTLGDRLPLYTTAVKNGDLADTTTVSTISHEDLGNLLGTYTTRRQALVLARNQETTLAAIDTYTSLYDSNTSMLVQSTFNGLTRAQATTDISGITVQPTSAESENTTWLSNKKTAYEEAVTEMLGALKAKLVTDISGYAALYTAYDGLDRSNFEGDLAPSSGPSIASGLANVAPLPANTVNGADDLSSAQALSTTYSAALVSAIDTLRDRYYGTPQTTGAIETLVVHVKNNLANYITDYKERYDALRADTTEGGTALTTGQTTASKQGLVDDLQDGNKLSSLGAKDALGAYTLSSVADMDTLLTIINAYVSETPDLREAMRIHAHKKATLARINLFETTRTTEFRSKVTLPTIAGYTYTGAARTEQDANDDRGIVKDATTFAAVDAVYTNYATYMAYLVTDAMAAFNKLYTDTAALTAYFLDTDTSNSKTYNAFNDNYATDSAALSTNTVSRNAEIVKEYVGYSVFIQSKQQGAQTLFQTVDELKQATLDLITTFNNERGIANQVLPTSATGAPSTAVGLAPSGAEATVLSVETREADILAATNTVNAATRTEQITPIQTDYLSHLNDVRLAMRTEAIAQLDAFQSQFDEWVAFKDTWSNSALVTAGTRPTGGKSPAEGRRDTLSAQVDAIHVGLLDNQDTSSALRGTIDAYRSYIATMRGFMAPPNGTTFLALKAALESKINQFAKDLSDTLAPPMGVTTTLSDTTTADKARLTTVPNILTVDTEYDGTIATLLADVREPTQGKMDAYKSAYERDVSGAVADKMSVDPKTGYANLTKAVGDLSGSAPRLYAFRMDTATVEDTLAVYTVYRDLLEELPFEVKRAEALVLIDTLETAVTAVRTNVTDPEKTTMLSGIPTLTATGQAKTAVSQATLEATLTGVTDPYTAALAELRNRLATHVGSVITAYETAYEDADAKSLPPLFSEANRVSLLSRYNNITPDRGALPNSSITNLLSTLSTYTDANTTLSGEVETANATLAFNALKGQVSGLIDTYAADLEVAGTIVGLDLSGVTTSASVTSNKTDIQSSSISRDTLNSMKSRYTNDALTIKARVKAKAITVLQTFNAKFTDQQAASVTFTPALNAALSDLSEVLAAVNAGTATVSTVRDYIFRYTHATSDVLALLPGSALVPQNRIDTEQVITGFQTRFTGAAPYGLTYSNELMSANPLGDKAAILTLTLNTDITNIRLKYQSLSAEIDGKVAAATATIAAQKEAAIAEARAAIATFGSEFAALDAEVKKEYPQLTTTHGDRQQDTATLNGDREHTSITTYASIVQKYNRGLDVLRNGRRAYEVALLATKRQTALAVLEAYSTLFGNNIRMAREFSEAIRQAYVDVKDKLDVVKRPAVTLTELDAITTAYRTSTAALEAAIRGVQTANITEAIQVIRRFKILFGNLTASARAALPTSIQASTASVLRDLDILSSETVSNEDIGSIQRKYTAYVATLEKVAPPGQVSTATLQQQREAVVATLREFNTTVIKNSHKLPRLSADVLRRLRTIATDLTYVQETTVTDAELRGIQADYAAGLVELNQLLTDVSQRPLPAETQNAAIQQVLSRFIDLYTTTDRSTLSLTDANYVKLLFENQDNVYVYQNVQDALDAFTRGIDILVRAPKRTVLVETPSANPEFDQLAYIIDAYLREFPLRRLGRAIPTDRLLLSELKRNAAEYLKMYEVRDPQQRNYSVLVERLMDQYRDGLRLLRSYPLK